MFVTRSSWTRLEIKNHPEDLRWLLTNPEQDQDESKQTQHESIKDLREQKMKKRQKNLSVSAHKDRNQRRNQRRNQERNQRRNQERNPKRNQQRNQL